jgi:hypothetical protein
MILIIIEMSCESFMGPGQMIQTRLCISRKGEDNIPNDNTHITVILDVVSRVLCGCKENRKNNHKRPEHVCKHKQMVPVM